MKKAFPVMKTCPLFAGIAESDYENLLAALSAKEDFFPKNETVIQIGDSGKRAGLVLSGVLEVSFYDENAALVSVTRIEPGNVFGAMMLCAKVTDSPIHLRAVSDCTLLFLDFSRLLQNAARQSTAETQRAANLLGYFARRSFLLTQKIRILGQKKLRDKLKLYFTTLPKQKNGIRKLPLSKTELASFLYADRSALSRELSRMQEEGIIAMDGKEIVILDPDFLD